MATHEAVWPTVAGYAVLRALGSGQYGDVFLVRRIRDARLFAAKIPRASGEAEAQEAMLLQALKHPNVVGCEEIVRVDGGRRLVIIMEYAARGDLEAYIRGFAQRKDTIPEDEIMRIFIQIALALSYLHGQRVIHRDLKPKNILLDEQGVVKLSDFGVSRLLQHTLDAAQTVTGTPYYMSPELMDNQPYDGKTDVWSLGCILFELAALVPPFAAKALAALVMQIVSHPPPTLPPIYSRGLDSLVKKLLAKDPIKRPSIYEVLVEPIVQQHLMRLASTAPMQCTLQSLHVDGCARYVVNNPSLAPYAPNREDTQHTQQSGFACKELKNLVVAQIDRAAQPGDELELRRKMFFENQAAAQRNKDRVALEKAAPPAFLYHEDSLKQAERVRQVAIPVQPRSQDSLDAARERTRQFYLENARAAKLNKQRALEAMKGQTEAVLLDSPDVATGVNKGAAPPPAPPRHIKASSSGKDYEALLEEERRRVRMERKLLYERMREQQVEGASHSAEVVTATDPPSGHT